MAKKKEIEKEVETKEESKLSFKDVKKKALKYIKKNKETIIKGIVSVTVILFVLIVGIVAFDAIKENSLDNIDYPLVYRKENGEIILLESEDEKGKDGYVLSTSDGTGYTTYGNSSNRYVLTKKENDLYIYDTKKEEKPSKIADDISNYYFSDNDSFVIFIDTDLDLYSYNYKEAKKILDGNVSSIIDYSDKAVIYERRKELYYSSLNPDKEDRKKIVNGYKSAAFSEDGKAVLYTNTNNALYRYDIRKDKHTKIGSKVDRFYCDSKSCKNIYFTSAEVNYNLYFYNGKKSEKIVERIYDLVDVNADNKTVLYTKNVADDLVMYYKKSNNEEYRIDKKVSIGNKAKFVEDSVYILDKNDELYYAKISGNKLTKLKTVDKEVESGLMNFAGGLYYSKNSNKNNEATFYVVKNGKKTKVDDDIIETKISISNNGKKMYYIADIEKNEGTLYVFDGTKSKKISDKVHKMLYIRDDMVYYLKNYNVNKRCGELYRYDGKSTKIEDKVSDLSSTPNSYIVK